MTEVVAFVVGLFAGGGLVGSAWAWKSQEEARPRAVRAANERAARWRADRGWYVVFPVSERRRCTPARPRLLGRDRETP